jgi:hypothetical protein
MAAERALGAMAGDSPSHATKRVTVKPLAQLRRRHQLCSTRTRWSTTGTTKRESATGCMSRRRGVWTSSSHTGRCEALHPGMRLRGCTYGLPYISCWLRGLEMRCRLDDGPSNDTDNHVSANEHFRHSSRCAPILHPPSHCVRTLTTPSDGTSQAKRTPRTKTPPSSPAYISYGSRTLPRRTWSILCKLKAFQSTIAS